MRMQCIVGALVLLMLAGSVSAQTLEIQKQVQKKLDEKRKEQTGLDELFAQALKNNPDIRVAEAKLREAEAELYRMRVNVLNRVVMQRNEIRSAKAAADEATSRYQREKELAARGASSAPEVSAARAAAEKFNADLAVKEAELDLLLGKHQGKAAELLNDIPDRRQAPPDSLKPAKALVIASTLPAPMIDRICKALNAPVKIAFKGEVPSGEIFDFLRRETKGVNVVRRGGHADVPVITADLGQSVPLGALYQWVEDTLNVRFIVRDYGIVVLHDGEEAPPGAVRLLDLWRKCESEGAGGQSKAQ